MGFPPVGAAHLTANIDVLEISLTKLKNDDVYNNQFTRPR